MSLSVEELVKLCKGKGCLVRQSNLLQTKIGILQKELDELQEKLRIVSAVSLTYHNGVPLSGGGCGWRSLTKTADGKYRSARIYLNANNKKTWGVQMHTGLGFHDDVWLGAGYSSKEAKKVALDFIVTGIVIPEKDRKY
jgi:hypothetical protein